MPHPNRLKPGGKTIAKRKHLRFLAQKQHGEVNMIWCGGILYFKDSMKLVPNIPYVPRPGREAIGYEGSYPKAERPKKRYFRRKRRKHPN